MRATANRKLNAGWITWFAAAFLISVQGWAAEIPAKPLAELESEDFRTREEAQARILEWARETPEKAIETLYRHTVKADEPEVRERCLAVLRELVGDEYSRHGEGFIGIQMRDELATVPDDAGQRAAIRVTFVMPKSPAEKAGLEINDLIVAVEDKVWRKIPVILPFSEEIKKHKPGTRIRLSVLRDGKLIEVPVTLTRRPLEADTPFLDRRPFNMEAAEAAAREAHFQRWLKDRRERED
ncbi:MAG TPA: PDZ domain-containing protein [Luteolibacter sp.]|nr:PDZ domain-containing protein [Luteolibacter sp.]